MHRFALPNPGPCFVAVEVSAEDARASRSLNATPLIVNPPTRIISRRLNPCAVGNFGPNKLNILRLHQAT
jgi:hypothetical protein